MGLLVTPRGPARLLRRVAAAVVLTAPLATASLAVALLEACPLYVTDRSGFCFHEIDVLGGWISQSLPCSSSTRPPWRSCCWCRRKRSTARTSRCSERRYDGFMPRTPEQVWAPIAKAELTKRGVTGGTGFGNNEGLRVSGKIFAMLVRGELVVKLPKDRVDELVDSRVATRFDAGKGRSMKEWASVSPSASRRWKALVEEARAFVGSR
jgi:hypothetical protein